MSLSALHLAQAVGREQGIRARAAGQSEIWQVLLLPPNLVGHIRLILTVAAASAGPCLAALLLYAVSLLLDLLDGWLARRLRQETAFGAFYDVAVDNLTRALLWAGSAAGGGAGGGGGAAGWAAAGPWAGVPVALEGITLACTHAAGGAAWKSGCFRDAPRWVHAVARGGFRSPAGTLAMAGLFGCPLWLFARCCLPPGSLAAAGAWGLVLIPGRLLAAAVEIWLVQRRARQLLEADIVATLRRQAG